MKIKTLLEQPTVDLEQVKQMILKLPVDRKIRLLKYLEKSTKTPIEPEDNPNIIKGTESIS